MNSEKSNNLGAIRTLKIALDSDLTEGFKTTEKSENNRCFVIKPINDFIEDAKNRPIPKNLFSGLWHENELCILFSAANIGKSILALQISNSITKGICIDGFINESQAQKVLYFDFELSDKQIENRYSKEYADHYVFNSNLLRVELNRGHDVPCQFKNFEEYLNYSIEKAIIEHQTKILVIDNLTYLKSDTEKAKDATPLMTFLNILKAKYRLSILVLAHTPKRNSSKPLELTDLAGSSNLGNFCDSCFAIGKSFQDQGLRYIKQLKQRETACLYDYDNVIICKIEKRTNFLEFIFEDFGNEYDHLSPNIKQDQLSEVLALKKQNVPNTQIANQLGISEGTIRNWIIKSEK